MKTTLLIPTLNEIIGMKVIMPRIKREWVDDIVFIDGHSTDGTIDYIKSHGYTLILESKPKAGARAALIESFDKIPGDIIITFSPDGNCVPELIPQLIEKMKEGYDMVIASRYAKGAISEDDSLVTAFGNWMFTNFINIFFAAKYTDVMNIFRAYKKSLIKELDLDKDITYLTPESLFKTKIGWEPILSLRAAKKKLKVGEIPGDEPKRIGGQAKLKILQWGAAYLYQFIREIFWWH